MAMNTTIIVAATERLETICHRLARPSDQARLRQELVAGFERLATDLGKLCEPCGRPEWQDVSEAMTKLRWDAVMADESRASTFSHLGTEAALIASLHAFAAVLGFTLADAATARPDDEDAMRAVEGTQMEAAE